MAAATLGRPIHVSRWMMLQWWLAPAVATELPEGAHSMWVLPGIRVAPVLLLRRRVRLEALCLLLLWLLCGRTRHLCVTVHGCVYGLDRGIGRTWSLLPGVVRRLHPVLPALPESVETVGDRLFGDGTCAAASLCAAAKDRLLALGFKWSVFLDRSVSRMVSSVSGGFGPPRLCAVLVVLGSTKLELPQVSTLSGAPLGLKTSLSTGLTRVKYSPSSSRLRLFRRLPWPFTRPSDAMCWTSRATSWRRSRSSNMVWISQPTPRSFHTIGSLLVRVLDSSEGEECEVSPTPTGALRLARCSSTSAVSGIPASSSAASLVGRCAPGFSLQFQISQRLHSFSGRVRPPATLCLVSEVEGNVLENASIRIPG